MSVNCKRCRDTAAATTATTTGSMVLDLSTISLSSRVTVTSSGNKENHDITANNNNSILMDIQSAITTKQRLIAFHRLRKMLHQSNHSEKNNNMNTSTVSTTSSAAMEGNSQCVASQSNASTSILLEQFIINDGGLTTMILQLHHLVHAHGSTMAELELLCNCFAILFRAIRRRNVDTTQINQYVLQQHGLDLLTLLSNASILVSSQRRQQHQQRQKPTIGTTDENLNTVLYDVASIFNIISASYDGTNCIIKCRMAIETLIRMFVHRIDPTNNNNNDDHIVLEVLGCFKNLTYYQEDCRIQLTQAVGFINNLGSILSPPKKQKLSMKSRQRLSSVIRNLTITIECRTILVARPTIIDTLIQLLDWEELQLIESVNGSNSSTYNNTQRNVILTFVSLAMDRDSALILIFYGDGILLNILQQYLKVSSDVFLRKKSACILRLLVHEVSAPLLVHNANLMYSLSDAALRDDSSDVRKEAAEAFAKCAAFVQVVEQQSQYYDNVLDALTVLVQTRRGRLKAVAIDSLARALREQSSHESNQRPMADRSILLDAISEIAISRGESESSTASRDATHALMNLSTNDDNLEQLTRNPLVLDALLSIASSYRMTTYYDNERSELDEDNGKTFALTALVNLARNAACREIMIRHGCLLQTLIQEIKYVPTEQSVLKERMKQAALLLASDL